VSKALNYIWSKVKGLKSLVVVESLNRESMEEMQAKAQAKRGTVFCL